MRHSYAKLHLLAPLVVTTLLPSALHAQQTITGQAAFADYTQQKPGVRRKITVADLPEPKPSESVDNGPSLVQRPEGAWPIAPAGFKVQLYAVGDAAIRKQARDARAHLWNLRDAAHHPRCAQWRSLRRGLAGWLHTGAARRHRCR